MKVCHTNINGKDLHFIAVDNLDKERFVRNRTGKENILVLDVSPNLYVSEQAIDRIVERAYIDIAKEKDKGFSIFLYSCLLYKDLSIDNYLMVVFNEFTMRSLNHRKDYKLVDDNYNLFHGVWWTRNALVSLGEKIDSRESRSPIYFGCEGDFQKRTLFPLRCYFDGTCMHPLS